MYKTVYLYTNKKYIHTPIGQHLNKVVYAIILYEVADISV